MAERAAAAGDLLLDFMVVAFGAWTLLYHVCLVLRLSPSIALGCSIALTIAGWAIAARMRAADAAAPPARGRTARAGLRTKLLAASAGCGLTAATLFAFASISWTAVWGIWVVAAVLAIAAIGQGADRSTLPIESDRQTPRWLEPAVVGIWALALATLSLLLLEPDGDDAYYVHLAAWISHNGSFPLHDVLYSNNVFPALYYPPVPSFEALIGTLGHLTGSNVQDVFYFALPPVATALAVLALWRLLRAWKVAEPALALSVALTFLLFASAEHRMFGAFFVGRIWQGKVIFLTTVLPVLFALFNEYAERDSRRALFLLGAAAVAAVGLTTTAIFVVPVVAAACMAPLALRAPRKAIVGFAAGAGYPIGAAVVTLALGGRTPETYQTHDVMAGMLIHFSLGTGVAALVAVTAVLVGPLLLRQPAAAMAAVAALLVALLFAPPTPKWILDLTGLGRVLWRLAWALPVAALVGACATALWRARLPASIRVLPALAIAGALIVGGHAIWSLDGVSFSSHPIRKLAHGAVVTSILDHARPGDVVLAPQDLSQEVVKDTGTVTAVSARDFYTAALEGVPAARVPERTLLQRFADAGLSPPHGPRLNRVRVRVALRRVSVDLACLDRHAKHALELLRRAGFRGEFAVQTLRCVRAP